MRHWELSDTGRVRKENQDSCRVVEYEADDGSPMILALVCDGMGGAKGGAVASSLAADCVTERIAERKPGMAELHDELKQAAELANRMVFERSQKDSECSGMGTTLVAAVSDGKRAVVMNVGDSRCYLIRGESIEQITKDHSLVEGLVDSGEITREEARNHPKRNIITRAVGVSERLDCDFFEAELGDQAGLLLCSDGLSTVLEDREILSEVLQGERNGTAVSGMVERTLDRGAPDNVTAILLAARPQ